MVERPLLRAAASLRAMPASPVISFMIMATESVVNSLQREVELAKEGLKNVDESIKKLTGRDPSEARGPGGNRRMLVRRNVGERIGGPPAKRFNAGLGFNNTGPRANRRHFGQLESDGEEEEDDGKKPTLQSSIVAKPGPSREAIEANTDNKTKTRNKRMFGVLLGTLQKFKENSTREAARERKRKQIEIKLEEAAAKEREEAFRKKKELFSARREQKHKIEELERKMEVAEMLEEWDTHDRKLSKFIRTNAKPHIFYLPAKHNDYTLGLLEKNSQHVEEEIKIRREEIVETMEKKDGGDEGPGEESMIQQDVDLSLNQSVLESDNEEKEGRKVVSERQRNVVFTSKDSEILVEKHNEINEVMDKGDSMENEGMEMKNDELIEKTESYKNEMDVKSVEKEEIDSEQVDENSAEKNVKTKIEDGELSGTQGTLEHPSKSEVIPTDPNENQVTHVKIEDPLSRNENLKESDELVDSNVSMAGSEVGNEDEKSGQEKQE